MKKSVTVLLLATAFIGTVLFAQGERRRGGNTERSTPQTQTETLKKWEEVQAQLKQKYPEKYAEIETLQKTNLFAALEKMRALAKEGKIETPKPGRGGREGFARNGREGGEGSQQDGPPSFGERGDGFRQGGGFNRQSPRAEAEEQLKKQFPAEYAEVEKLRASSEEKLQALAKKANVKLPETMETMRVKMAAVREKYKAEFAEIDKLRETDPRAAMDRTREIYKKEGIEFGGMMGMGRGGMTTGERSEQPQVQRRTNSMDKLNQVRRKYPEEMTKLDTLRRENPEEYRKQLKALIEKYDAEQAKEKEKQL